MRSSEKILACQRQLTVGWTVLTTLIVNYRIATKCVGTLCYLKNLIIDIRLVTFLHLHRLLHSPNNKEGA